MVNLVLFSVKNSEFVATIFGPDFEGVTGMKGAYKIWIDQNGKAFGDGPYDLLKGVEKTGSLHKVADQMGMAYSKAWTLIRTLEQRLGFLLLDRKVGGRSGGGSQITPQAKELMLCYGRFREEAKDTIEKIYQKHFVSFGKPGSEKGGGVHKGRRVKRRSSVT